VVDAVVAGHICLDIIPSLPGEVQIEPGKLVEAGPVAMSSGGAVSNTGLALAKLGLGTRLLGKVGDDLFGRAILGRLGPLGADMLVSPGEATSYTMVINLSGRDRSFLHAPGCNNSFSARDVPDRLLAETRHFHFGYPTLMAGMFRNDGEEMVSLFRRAKSHGATTSLDVSLPDLDSAAGQCDWKQILQRTLPYVDLFVPNSQELHFMLDRPGYLRGAPLQIKALAGEAIRLGAHVVGVKAGSDGLFIYAADRFAAPGRALPETWQDSHVHQPCFPVEVEGTTGAGDATVAGLLAGMLWNMSPQDAARVACGTGAFCCEQPDATGGLPTRAQLEARFAGEWAR
jgi:sugar/nucleoside kinase (ribokinase family)